MKMRVLGLQVSFQLTIAKLYSITLCNEFAVCDHVHLPPPLYRTIKRFFQSYYNLAFLFRHAIAAKDF